MFVGHYAAAMAAKAIEPKAPMWTLAAAAQLVDIGWSAFIVTGIEHASVDSTLPGSTLVLDYMPWTHSLPAALVWSIGAALLVRLFVPKFSIVRMLTRVVGYHLMTTFLLDQTRPLRLPGSLNVQVQETIRGWSDDPKEPRWLNRIEDRLTTRGTWGGGPSR